MRSFVKINPSPNGKITLSFITDIGKSYLSCDFLTSQICLLRLFAKIKFSRKFPNFKYSTLTWRVELARLWLSGYQLREINIFGMWVEENVGRI